MIKIAITGKIGTGKTTVSAIIKSLGYNVYESDIEVKNLFKDSIIAEKIKKEFKNHIPNLFYKNGLINKKSLGNYVFFKKSELAKLEKIIHPELKKKKEKFLRNNDQEKFTFFDIPLLFEKKLHKNYDFIIYTYVDKTIQAKRVLTRKGIDSKKYQNILAIQDHSYAKLKQYVSLYLDTDNEKNYLLKKIEHFLKTKQQT